MNGNEFLADTNAVIYLLDGNPCMTPYLHKKLAISVISYMELLSFPRITAEGEGIIRRFLDACDILSIDTAVREQTIRVRKKHRSKLPDSIIAATSMIHGLPLLTADTGFLKFDELQIEQLKP